MLKQWWQCNGGNAMAATGALFLNAQQKGCMLNRKDAGRPMLLDDSNSMFVAAISPIISLGQCFHLIRSFCLLKG